MEMKTKSFAAYQERHLVLLLFACLLFFITFFFVYPNDLAIQSLFFPSSGCGVDRRPDLGVSTVPYFRMLMGVFSRTGSYERRQLIRMVNARYSAAVAAHFDIRFVICGVDVPEDHAVIIAMEAQLHGDILVLNCTAENLNWGKILTYFCALQDLYGGEPRPYDYAMKADDDAYYRLDNFVAALSAKPREDLYYGLEMPCKWGHDFGPFPGPFMTGIGYVVSWDVVEWLATSEIPRQKSIGPEDMMVGIWLREGGKGRNWIDAGGELMYDIKLENQTTNCFRHDLTPETVTVHRLKTNELWSTALTYFNVTVSLSSAHYNNPKLLAFP